MSNSQNNNPSLDPAFNDSLVGSITFAFQKMMQQINGMMPAQVIAYDRTTNRVQIQLLITILTTDGSQVPRPQIASLPVMVLGGGDFVLSFPLKAGDFGWVLAADRDISNFLQSYQQSQPNTNRIKNFSDGVFIPDAMKNYNITTANKDYVLMQSTDGTTVIQMGVNPTSHLNEINIKADVINLIPNNSTSGFVNIYGNLAVSGTVTNTLGAFTAAPVVPVTPYPPG